MTDQAPQNILIVDDTPANLDLLERILENCGYEVRSMPNGPLALKSAAHMPPDLILLDIKMPGMDGYEVCAHLKQQPPTQDIPIIFISALQESDDKVRAFQAGGVDYVTKPFQADEVLARVHTHLEISRMRSELAQQNEELVAAAKLRDDVERITRHDLKSPLNSIIAVPSILVGQKELDQESIDLLHTVERSGRKMLELINRSLDLYKMETGVYQTALQPMDLLPVLRSAASEASADPAASDKTWRITRAGQALAEGDEIWAEAEEMLCYPMFSNLIKNAFEASPEGGEVEIDLDESDASALKVSIANQGAVPAAIRDTFFGKYVTHGKSSGTGLGTYSAKLCAETQEGKIALVAEDDDSTRVIVTLKRTPPVTKDDLDAMFKELGLRRGV